MHVGPVLHWELVRAARRPVAPLLRAGYVAWLFVQFLFLIEGLASEPRGVPPSHVASSLSTLQQRAAARSSFAARYVADVLYWQLILILLITPAFTAGALGHEKERNTLTALLCTQLESEDIVVGKLLGRLAVLGNLAFAGLPFVVPMAVIGDLDLGRILLAVMQQAILTAAVAAASMLAAVWTRRTNDAILACYSAIVVLLLIGPVILNGRPVPAWLDPFVNLDPVTNPKAEPPPLFPVHLAIWLVGGALCLTLAERRLRPASLHQLERRPSRLLWAFRPRVGNAPIRWREQHVIGLSPLPWLRIVPGWMAKLGILIFSAMLAATGLNNVTGKSLFPALEARNFTHAGQALQMLDPGAVPEEIFVMGCVLFAFTAVVVGVRCSTSIAEEKRRKTWDDLILTALPLDEIVREKRWGIIQAATPYLAVYALPMFALAAFGGMSGVVAAMFWVGGSWVCTLGAARFGMAFAGEQGSLSRMH
jgi:ABC-type transport system involved in multi-copper enzyme maturation permease subunit